MSPALSNVSISLPLYSSNKPRNLHHFPFVKLPQNLTNKTRFRTTAAAANRGNLDHLQRATTKPDKKRVVPVAPTGPWDRLPTARTVQQMMETMERIMEEPFAYSSAWPSSSIPENSRGRRRRQPWEIKEREGEYKMRFDMPGMTKDDVEVWVEEKMLVFKAEKVGKKEIDGEEEEEEWDADSFGRYGSRIALPENVEFDKIKAEVKDGVLYITIPKASHNARIFNISVH